MAEEKEKVVKPKVLNLTDFIKESKKLFGKDSIIDLSKEENYGDIIPFSSFSLNNALDIGGAAMNKITVFDGDSSSGKSTTAYDAIASCQKKYNRPCLLIDKERSYTTTYGKKLGIDNSPEMLVVLNPKSLEEMYEAILVGLESKIFGVIVVDSVTAFAPEARFEGSVVMGIESRVNSDKMRLVNNLISTSNTALIMIQQIRQKIGAIGDPTTVSGGMAIPFYAHVRIRITRSKIDRENQENVMKFTVIKNKLGIPFKVGTVVFNWNRGFDASSEIAELAVEFGIIKKEGKTYILSQANPDKTDVKLVGKKKTIEFLNSNIEYRDNVIKPLLENELKSTALRSDEIDEEEISN